MEKMKIGITVGDINGIGLEVILKTLSDEKMLRFCTPIVYGSSKVVSYHKNIIDTDFHFHQIQDADQAREGEVNILNCWQENVNITLGKVSEEGGKYALYSLQSAVYDLRDGKVDALVTAPINKEAMKLSGFPHPGHTEYISEQLGGSSLMFMIYDDLRIGLVTNHLPVHEVAQSITQEAVLGKIKTMEDSLRRDFGFERPTIAVLGLNPHAGDGGAIGPEDEEIIRPAVAECKASGSLVMGPFPADGFFGSGQFRKFDGILAMYHDQGLVPFKLLSFGKGVNFTAGLGGVRTSPDHGTGFDIAGKNEANPTSFRQALYAAIDISRHRKQYVADHANPLNRSTSRKGRHGGKRKFVKSFQEEEE